MKPSLNFSQGVPGKSGGRPSGIIETAALIPVTDAIRMLADAPSWTPRDEAGMKQWFAAYLGWLSESDFGIAESKAGNNHGVWYDAQVAAFAWFAGRRDLAGRVEKVGVNLWDYRTEDGRSLRAAVAYLVPYLVGQKSWPHQRIVTEREVGFARYLAMA